MRDDVCGTPVDRARASSLSVRRRGQLCDNVCAGCKSTARALAVLRHRLVSTQELTAINLDVYRNRIIRMELNMTMAGVALAMTTSIAGLFGMNLPIPGIYHHNTARRLELYS
jgi:hypothetical protein